jgi:hypothetical protein
MELFDQLGAEIEDLWRATNYNEERLPAIAADALKRARLPEKLSAWDVVEWSLKQTELPPQRDLPGKFGDPPITIYVGPRFHIDVYFWFEGTTAIHQHGFCGAFQVLLGSSIHSWYEFDRSEVINTFTEIGTLSLKVCELLEVGDVQETIWAGRQYIHSLFHLDQPIATIVVRTDKTPLYLPQFAYHKPSLAIDPFFEQATTTKKVQVLSALIRAKREDADAQIAALLETCDLQTSFMILSQLRGLFRSDQISKLFKLDEPRARFERFLDIVRERHGPAGASLGPVFHHYDHLDEIVMRRQFVTKPEHRFFMALLLNIDDRTRIFSLIKQRYPDADPIEKVLDWVFDLAETRVVGLEASNALGIPDFGNAEMFVLEKLLHGNSDDEIRSAFAAENPGADTSLADAAIAKVRAATIFRPLLA